MLRLSPNHWSHLRRLPPYGWHSDFGCYQLSWLDGRCVQGPGTYSPRPADSRLLAIPASCSRVADCNPDYDRLSGISSLSRVGCPLYRPLYYVLSPTHKGHEDLTSSPPSSGLSPAVSPECPPLRDGNRKQGLRSLRDLTQHLTTRADDSHAAPIELPLRESAFADGHLHFEPG